MQKIRLLVVALTALVSAAAQDIKYTHCDSCWNADSLGNHRVVVRFEGSGAIARVVIPWRRRDEGPELKRIIVQDGATGRRILNAVPLQISRESGEILFEPLSGKGTYYVYYLPYRNEGRSNYPKGVYWKPDTTAAAEWVARVGKTTGDGKGTDRTGTMTAGAGIRTNGNGKGTNPVGKTNDRTGAMTAGAGKKMAGGEKTTDRDGAMTGRTGPGAAKGTIPLNCTVTEFQSIDAFDDFYPMEVIATAKETATLTAKYSARGYIVFPEDRLHPIRMTRDLPYRWVRQGPAPGITGEADRGEYYAFQLGVYALRSLEDVELTFSDLVGTDGKKIPAGMISCINTQGISYDGKPFIKNVDVPEGTVQALWCGVDVPATTQPGSYAGTVQIKAKGMGMQPVAVRIKVSSAVSKDGGAGSPEKMTRLKWLNSTLAQENTVIAPYTPLTVQGDTLISLLGRTIQLGAQGFPEQIQTFFTPEMTGTGASPNKLLAENIHFHFTRQSDGKDIRLQPKGVHFTLQSPGTLQWEADNSSEEITMQVSASLEFDGALAYTVKVTALRDLDLKDITMHIPFQPSLAKYMMGLGLKGGNRPDSVYAWKWDVAHKNQDGAWIGTVNAGLQYSLRDEKYVRPLNTNFYLQKPLLLPASWGNEGKGGISVGIKGKSMLANNYTGPRHMQAGEVLYYNFNLLITPFHAINTDFQWATRFYHRFNNPDSIKATGATVVNIHHATPINPYINYPFIEWQKMKDYIDKAHTLGLKVKIYNTVRELSDHAYETPALRSLNKEIYSAGPGGGFSWLQEHIGDNYIAAWFVPEIKDAALVNSGMSRWHNYYVEGMNWLVANTGIDGIYLDDVAFDRVTMKRIKRVLTQNGHPGIIDLHSANQYNRSDGYNNSGNLYMEHFPYLNRLWFGEYFDYEKNPADFFLTEVSGIPFGLMGEMLEGGGNAWRGMIYGMTNRMPWTENSDPRPIWQVWDAFGMEGTSMLGYWSPSCPVKTDQEKVLATVYLKKGAMLVSLASWAEQDTGVHLLIDWKVAGIDPAHATIQAADIKNFQPARSFRIDEAIPVPKGKGWLLVIK